MAKKWHAVCKQCKWKSQPSSAENAEGAWARHLDETKHSAEIVEVKKEVKK